MVKTKDTNHNFIKKKKKDTNHKVRNRDNLSVNMSFV